MQSVPGLTTVQVIFGSLALGWLTQIVPDMTGLPPAFQQEAETVLKDLALVFAGHPPGSF